MINRIKNGPDYPFLGLKYVTEYLNPGNPNKDPMYTCSLEGNTKMIMNSYLLGRNLITYAGASEGGCFSRFSPIFLEISTKKGQKSDNS